MFFWGNKFNNNEVFELDQANEILQHSEYKSNLRTALYIHGYIEGHGVESVHVIIDAYQQRATHNLIVLDWGNLADGNYFLDALQNMKQVNFIFFYLSFKYIYNKFFVLQLGPKMAEVLIDMVHNGLDLEKFHLVGHSMGGQLSGLIGRKIIEKTNGACKLPRF